MELDAPNLNDLDKQYLNKMIDSGFVSTFGPFVPEFEERVACYLGVKKTVATQSGTAAIHMALYELGIGQGDEVIVPALTFVATVNPITYVGAVPVFSDVDLRAWTIDPASIEKCITEKTKVIMPVHLYGNPCDMDSIMEIARKYRLYVIEDAAESLGSTFQGKQTGTIGNLGCLSFNGNKTITTGGGGMVVGNDAKQIEHIKFLVNQARDESLGYYHPEIGFNYRMTNLVAALGLAQMEKLKEFLEKKRTFHTIYAEELGKVQAVTLQEPYAGSDCAWWFTCVTIDKKFDVAQFQKGLKERGIPTRRVFMPITDFPPYKGSVKADLSNTYQIYDRGLCLPSSTLNTYNDVRHVCKVIKEMVA